MDEVKEKFLETLDYYPHQYEVIVKQTPYTDLNNIVITNPKGRSHHVFLPNREDQFRFELLSSLVVLGEKHHLFATDYYDEYTQEYLYDQIEQFNRLIRPIRYAWAGQIAAQHSPDVDLLLQETLKAIEIEYLNQLYKDNRRAAIDVMPYIAFAKALDMDWEFFNHDGLNRLVNEIVQSKPSKENLLKYAKRLTKFIPCFFSFDIVTDPKRGFEVFSLDY
ncbi:MAG: hypothetical protein GXN97_00665 [Aquificae bacterium]|jgi:hypothetical protein|nr:hypothetical protein [Aquificota bacterium]